MAFTPAPKFVTPKGTFIWPKLNEPDTKHVAEGVYEVKLAFEEGTDLSNFKAKVQKQIDRKYDEMVAELTEQGKAGLAKKITKRDIDEIFKPEEDEATGDETGRIIVKAKMKASGISKKTGKTWNRRPDVMDAKGNKIMMVLKNGKPNPNAPAIGGGTEGKLCVELSPYYFAKDKEVGCSLRLEAAQIIKLVSFGERNASDYGFGSEDGDDLSGANDIDQDMEGDVPSDEEEDDEL